jgi:hypothetical protein
VLTSREYFPTLLLAPFQHGLGVVFIAAAGLSVVSALASMLRGGRYTPPEPAQEPARGLPAEVTKTPTGQASQGEPKFPAPASALVISAGPQERRLAREPGRASARDGARGT